MNYQNDVALDSPTKLLELAISLLHEAYALKAMQDPDSNHEVYGMAILEKTIEAAEEVYELFGGDDA